VRWSTKHGPVVGNGAEELDQTEIEARIKAVRELWAIHQEDAAILLAWSAIEAAMRLVAKRESIELENDQPAFLLKKLFSLGLLSREDFGLFQEGMRFRSLIVHGYRSPRPEREFVSRLLRRVEELLTTNAKHSSSR